MNKEDALVIINAFKGELECSVKYDLYTTLDTGSCQEILDALNLLLYRKD